MRHVLSILLQNESGALARVASMFSSRGFNIESLSVAPTEDPTVSRLTLVTTGDDHVISQISKQLAKLVDVVAIADRTSIAHIERELGLLKLLIDPGAEPEVRKLVDEFDANVLDEDPDHFTVEVTGNERQVDSFLERLPAGVEVLTVVRSGPLVVSRGPESLAEQVEL